MPERADAFAKAGRCQARLESPDSESDLSPGWKAIDHAYDEYVTAARAVHSNELPALVNLHSKLYAQVDAFDVQAQRMSDLVHQLADAHRTAEAGFLASANAL